MLYPRNPNSFLMHTKKKIIIAAHDAGGMDSLLPVLGRLFKDSSYEVTCLAHGPAKKLLDRQQYRYADADTLNEIELGMLVQDLHPDLILTGTSSGITIEKKLLKIAQAKKIPNVAIIDFWINYNLQFSFNPLGRMQPEDLPDYILVMDDLAKREMIAEGFPKDKLIITGNPHFENFQEFPPLPGPVKTIAFIDQPFSDLKEKGFHENMGFDELEVLRDLLRALTELNFQGEIIVKFHPSVQNRAKYDELARSSSISVVRDNKESLDAVLAKSHIIIGMTSMALFEAALGGKTVISYQPHPERIPDPLITNRLGLSHFAYTDEDFKRILSEDIKFPEQNNVSKKLVESYTKSGATLKVIQVIDKMMNNSKAK